MGTGDGTPPVKFTDENGNLLPDQEQKEKWTDYLIETERPSKGNGQNQDEKVLTDTPDRNEKIFQDSNPQEHKA